MLVERDEIRLKIRGLVRKLTGASDQHDDLLQEALLHLWRTEIECPGRTLSWYCQACCFHILHHLNHGRSVDSLRRRHLGCPVGVEGAENELNGDELVGAADTPLDYSCALDLVEQLASRLDGPPRRILGLLLGGYGVREIAGRVGLSPAAVVRHRERIAATAARLGARV